MHRLTHCLPTATGGCGGAFASTSVAQSFAAKAEWVVATFENAYTAPFSDVEMTVTYTNSIAVDVRPGD